ncbi:kinetochore protein Nuf2 isoform X1 [Rhinichthys klamathensis goyatoka]|uniref:kinetochore protein Nuf2 isoform X1 n=2 Tax=Rhinichthys klamathensis goyatoka TaxID=3034132 RepID=UPI0024B4D0D3|nr:kinetochore protein Nuf2 isoform X1 [Rhinichthys klamathensis goyatoka]
MSGRQGEKEAAGMNENTFPVYKVDVIVQFYRTEVLTGQEAKHFTKNDITPNPKAESIQRLYMRVLQLLFRFRPECHYTVPLSENVQFPMLYEWVSPVMSVYMRMCQFLPLCHVYDFSLNDLLNPKLKRTITILSAIQNFLHFRKQRLELTAAHQQSFRCDMDRLQAYTREIKEAEKKIEKLTTIPPEQQAEAKELASALAELTANTQREYQDVTAMNEMVAQCKTEIAEISQKLTQRKVDVATLKDEISKFKSQIVESPEELKSEMERMKENVKSIKMSKELADERLVELQMRVQCAGQVEAELQVLLKQLQDLQISMCKTNQQKEEVQRSAAMNEALQKELKSLSSEEAQMKRAFAMKLDKQSKHQIRRQKKKEVKDQQVKNIYGQYDKIHQKREEFVKKMEESNRETKRFKERMQELREKCSQHTQKAQEIYERLLTTLEQYNKRIEGIVVDTNADTLKMKSHF